MKYKVAIIDADQTYLTRISNVLGKLYADKVEIISYSNWNSFDNSNDKTKFDMVMVTEEIKSKVVIEDKLPLAILVEQNDIDKVDGIIAINKYQKHEIIMKQILDFCLEEEESKYTKKNVLGNTTKVYYVTSATGGTGTTSVAVALAKNLARKGKKVLYLSFEKNPATDIFFQGEGENCFSDVIYLIKSKKNNLMTRIENLIQKDVSGVYFIQPCRTVFDINELNVSEFKPLLQELCSVGTYESIIIDSMLEYNETGFFACDYSDQIVLVSDKTFIGEKKNNQLYTAFEIWDKERNSRFISKVQVIYNNAKVNSKNEVSSYFNVLGEIPRCEGAGENQIAEYISTLDIFDIYE